MKWESKIVGEGEESPEQLLANPNNWRIHTYEQQATMKAVLDEVGWVQRVVVNKTTGNVIDGHMRVSIAISEGEATIPVIYVALTPEQEKIILSTFDAIGAQAIIDPEAYAQLVKDMEVTDDYISDLVNSQIEDLDYLSYDSGLDKSLDELPKSQVIGTTYSLQIGFDTEREKIDFAKALSKHSQAGGYDYTGDYVRDLIMGL